MPANQKKRGREINPFEELQRRIEEAEEKTVWKSQVSAFELAEIKANQGIKDQEVGKDYEQER